VRGPTSLGLLYFAFLIADTEPSSRSSCDSLCLGLAIGLTLGVAVVAAIILVIVAWRRGRLQDLRSWLTHRTSPDTAELPPHKTVIYVSAEDKESSDRYCEIANVVGTEELTDVYLHPASSTVFDEAP